MVPFFTHSHPSLQGGWQLSSNHPSFIYSLFFNFDCVLNSPLLQPLSPPLLCLTERVHCDSWHYDLETKPFSETTVKDFSSPLLPSLVVYLPSIFSIFDCYYHVFNLEQHPCIFCCSDSGDGGWRAYFIVAICYCIASKATGRWGQHERLLPGIAFLILLLFWL